MSAAPQTDAPIHAILHTLLPPANFETTHAIIGTYSLDLVVAAAAMAHLAGFGGDDFRVNRVALATALSELEGKVRFIAQAARVKAPPNIGAFHALLLKFVDEAGGGVAGTHWHPKLALVRFAPRVGSGGLPIWRFWLGSHNFVRSPTWELGGVISTEHGRSAIAGLGGEIADLLARARFQVDPSLSKEIAGLKWNAGQPNPVTSVHLPGSIRPRWTLDAKATEALVISPFLDWRALGWLAEQLPRSAKLLTTRQELERLSFGAPSSTWVILESFEIFLLGSPTETQSTLSVGDDATDDDVAVERGLHAKALFQRRGGQDWNLQFGSANATRLGLGLDPREANFEVVATTALSCDEFAVLTDPLLKFAHRVGEGELAAMHARNSELEAPAETDPAALLADLAETLILSQHWSPEAVTLLATTTPQIPGGYRLSASALLAESAPADWLPASLSVDLPRLPATLISNHVVLHLRAESDPDRRASVLVGAPCDPPRDAAGDAELFRRALGPRGILEWLRGLLDGRHGDDSDWDGSTEADSDDFDADARDDSAPRPLPAAISLETILRAYARDAKSSAPKSGPVSAQLAAIERDLTRIDIKAYAHADPRDTPDDKRARADLRTFLAVWDKVRRTLMAKDATVKAK